MRYLKTAAFAALLLIASIPVQAQRKQAARAVPATFVAGVPDSALLAELRFRSLGPAVMSGRVSDIAVPTPRRAGEQWGKVIYAAAAAGGVWKSTNAGVTWTPLFDAVKISSIGAVAVAPTNDSIVYVGTGESNNLRSSSWGAGVYRSNDAGKTWQKIGLEKSQHIARIVVDPRSADVVYVAAMGPLWSAGGERGFYKTTDGGRTWRNTKAMGPYTGITDIVLDPTNPDIIYAATYQRDRRAYSFVAGGPESTVWKSADGGETWTRSAQGLPQGDIGRIGFDIARSQPQTLYATISAQGDSSGIYRSDDAGATWRKTNSLMSIPWYFGQLRVDPKNPERLYHLGVSLSVSDDGGKSFRAIANNTHSDHHALWIDPSDPDHLLLGNDGGFYTSYDRGATWDFALNLPISTYYAIAYDMHDPYWVYGGLQDNGSWGAPSRTRNRAGITNADWIRAGGGDGFYAAIDPQDPNVVYVESQEGALTRFDFATEERKNIRPTINPGDTIRYNWSAPLLVSAHDHNTLYFGANVLYRSANRGDGWQKISGDLSRGLNRDTLPIMGLKGPGGLGRNEGVAQFGNISTISESPLKRGLLYVGTDDGLVQLTRDDGATWTRIGRFPGVPALTYVSRVLASQHQEGTVYVALEGHRSNDFKPYLLKSVDYGKTFTSIVGNLPTDAPVYVVREDPEVPGLLYAGTEYGVFVSANGGGYWTQLKNGIAPAPVHDLLIHPRDRDLIVGTHGRGLYILDDTRALEQLARGEATSKVFPARVGLIQNVRSGASIPGNRNYGGQNPPQGALLTYYIANPPADATGALVITDAQGQQVRTLPVSLKPGLHRTAWDLRYDAAAPAQAPQRGADEDEDTPRFGMAPAGPYVYHGRYTVQLKLGPKDAQQVVAQQTIDVARDPDVKVAETELRALHDFRMRVYAAQKDVQQLVAQLEGAQNRLTAAMKDRDTTTAVYAQAKAARTELDGLLTQVRGARRAPGAAQGQATAKPPLTTRLNGVASAVGSAHFASTGEQQQTVNDAIAEIQQLRPKVADAVANADAAAQAVAK